MVRLLTVLLFICVSSVLVNADDPKPEKSSEDVRGQRLAEYLSGKKFVGQFTVDGSDNGKAKVEEYVISSCKKLAQDDLYRLTARIKYGQIDQEVPLEIKILFAGETPVITLDSMWIPGMGTFDARVLIRRGLYCGTWKHGAKGGHLFGKLEPIAKEAETAETAGKPTATSDRPPSILLPYCRLIFLPNHPKQLLHRFQVFDALLDACQWIGRLVLFNVAVGNASIARRIDDALHVDDAIANFLEGVLGHTVIAG